MTSHETRNSRSEVFQFRAYLQDFVDNFFYAKFILNSPLYFFSCKKSALAAVYFCLVGCEIGITNARSLTLNTAEISTLQLLVNKNAEAAALFKPINKAALVALDDKPNPIDFAVYEGTLATDPRKIDSKKAFKDMEKTEALAWAWAVTGDPRFLHKAHTFILSWAKKNISDGNPINETQFEPMVEAYDLIRDELLASETEAIDIWLHEKAVKLLNSTRGLSGNWQSHRLKMIGLIANTINNAPLRNLAYEGFKEQIENTFTADGASLDFKRRDSLHYHLYTIQPLLTLACVAKNHGESLFTYRATSGASLQTAVEFVRPYATGERVHIEFVHSTVAFDRKRANAGEEKYVPHPWEPAESIGTFTEAGCLDRRYDRLASIVAGKPDKQFLKWRTVLNASLRKQVSAIPVSDEFANSVAKPIPAGLKAG